MQIEQTLHAAFAPCDPATDFEDVVMRRVSAVAWRASQGPRKPGRAILFGTILVVAAAAAALVSQLLGSSAQVAAELPVMTEAVESPPEPAPLVQAEVEISVPAAAVDATPLVAPDAPMPPAAVSFTVLVQPLRLDTDVQAVEARVRAYFNALVDELRTVPGLVLIAPGAVNTIPADFRITVSGGEMGSGFMQGVTSWQVSLRTEAWQDGYRPLDRGTMGSGGILDADSCQHESDPRRCGPARDAVRTVSNLLQVFPSSPAMDELRSRYRAEAQAPAQQGVAVPASVSLQPGDVSAMDAETIGLILNRIAVVPEPGPRASLWLSLRGQVYPEQLQLLLYALRGEQADVVRRELITQLALEFADEPAARESLAAVAAVEPQPLARHVAERALFGDGPWRSFVAASLRDTGMTAAQRLEPLMWMLETRQRYPRVDSTLKDMLPDLLEADGARMLAGVLLRKQEESTDPLDALATGLVVAQLGAMDDPAAPELLLAWFDAAPSEDSLRLLGRHRDDSRIRTKLEGIVAGHPDPALRRMAASVLGQARR